MLIRIGKVGLWLAAAGIVWIVITAVMIWSFGNKDFARQSDCIIVLGAAAYGAKPSPVFEERIRHGINLLKGGKASTIIFTGGYGKGASHSESEVAAAFAINEGVSQSAILTEARSHTTNQNLIEAKALMDSAGLRTAIIVSDPLHLKRASVMAGDLGISSVTSPTPSSRYRSFRTKFESLRWEVYFYSHYLIIGD